MLLTPLNSIIHHFHLSFTDLIVLIKERHHNSTALGTITFGEMLWPHPPLCWPSLLIVSLVTCATRTCGERCTKCMRCNRNRGVKTVIFFKRVMTGHCRHSTSLKGICVLVSVLCIDLLRIDCCMLFLSVFQFESIDGKIHRRNKQESIISWGGNVDRSAAYEQSRGNKSVTTSGFVSSGISSLNNYYFQKKKRLRQRNGEKAYGC